MTNKEYSSINFMSNMAGATLIGAAIYNVIGAIIGAIFGLCFSLYYQHVKNKEYENKK